MPSTRTGQRITQCEESSGRQEPRQFGPILLPDRYEDGELDLFLTHFEVVAGINGWEDDATKAKFLAYSLKGKALAAYTYYSPEVRASYRTLVEELKKTVSPPELRCLRKIAFQDRVQQEAEDLCEYDRVLQRLFDSAYSDVPADLRDELIRDRFIAGLRDDKVRLAVRRSRPRSLNEAVSLSLEHTAIFHIESGTRLVLDDRIPHSQLSGTRSVDQGWRRIGCIESCGPIAPKDSNEPHVPVVAHVSVNSIPLLALFDSGSTVSILSSRLKSSVVVTASCLGTSLRTACGSSVSVIGEATALVSIGNFQINIKFMIADIVFDCVLGTDFLSETGAVLDYAKEQIQVPSETIPFWKKSPDVDLSYPDAEMVGDDFTDDVFGIVDENKAKADLSTLLGIDSIGVAAGEKETLKALVEEFTDIWSRGASDVGRTGLATHVVDTGDSRPIKQAPRRLPIHRRDEVNKLVRDMLDQGVISPSNSPWSTPIVLVKKKDGSTRFCIDFRKLNDVTVKDAYPIPRIDDLLDTLGGSMYFSTLDLASGYWQVEMDPASRPKTAFTTGEGLYEFNVMPFGLCNAPSTFQRLMHTVLSGIHGKYCLVYIDDVIVWSRSFNEHLARLREVFHRIRSAGLKLKPSKCSLFKTELQFLGHVVSAEGVKTDPAKVEAVQKIPVPQDSSALKSFLGLASYYRKFIPNFAAIASPLHRLLQKGIRFVMDQDATSAFELLKNRLINAPVMAYPEFGKTFVLDVDASETGLGYVLSQVHNDGERVISYGSRSLRKPERQYCVTRREMLAMITGIEHFKHYLAGKRFLLRTDHSALRWLKSFREPEGQVARWLETLANYDFDIVHRPGKSHGNADALSRCRQCGFEPTTEASTEKVSAATTLRLPSLETQLKEEQHRDPNIQQVFEWFERGERPSFDDVRGKESELLSLWSQWRRMLVTDDVLYRSWEDASGSPHRQLIVPRSMRDTVLKELHSTPTGAHLGLFKTLSKARSRFYWPGLQVECDLWIKNCESCNRRNMHQGKTAVPMKTSLSGFPFQRVGLDILGPFPRTERGNKYILVVSDYFTKWTEAYPLHDILAQTVASVFVEEFVCRYGAPTELHSDQGRQFQSAVCEEVCKLLDIYKTRTTPYHPQSDGLVERYHRTLCNMLSHFVNDRHTDWDRWLPYVMLGYRSSQHSSTQLSPYFALFAREVRLPVDVMFGSPEEQQPLNQHVAAMRKKFVEAYEWIRRNSQNAQRRQKDGYDRRMHARSQTFKEGDIVWLWTPLQKKGQSSKLLKPWSGPYVVRKALSDVTYRIEDLKNCRRRPIVHFNRLKKAWGHASRRGGE